MTGKNEGRRPLKSRSVPIFRNLAFFLVKTGLTPNQVSVLSAVFAAGGGAAVLLARHYESTAAKLIFLLLGMLGIQMRLLCNLVDGLMAIEGGKKTAYGELFNDFPDRVSDVILILACGYALEPGSLHTAAWIAALLAVMTAYIRVLGASMGSPHFFSGPMAKPHRMATLTIALAGSAVEVLLQGRFSLSLSCAIYLIALGTAVTCVRRLLAIKDFVANPGAK
jgi:phosphatidylglycerophosphate synthase